MAQNDDQYVDDQATDIDDDDLDDDDDDSNVAATADEDNPLVALEKQAVEEEEFSEPQGLVNSDPGVIDEEAWGAEEAERGAGAKLDGEDLGEMGMHVEDAPTPMPTDDDS